jgi:hypothetical protein
VLGVARDAATPLYKGTKEVGNIKFVEIKEN